MSHKHLLFNSEARAKVLRGASQIADAVRVTLGPKSKCVLIERKWGVPLVCNDGVTIAKEADLVSDLLFDGGFARKLIELGRRDAEAQHDRIVEFLRSSGEGARDAAA